MISFQYDFESLKHGSDGTVRGVYHTSMVCLANPADQREPPVSVLRNGQPIGGEILLTWCTDLRLTNHSLRI